MGRDRLGAGGAQIAHHGHRFAEGRERMRNRRQQRRFVFRGDLHRVQHPATPAVETKKQAALACLAGGVDV